MLELEATLRLDTDYIDAAEEIAAWNDVEYLAAATRASSRHKVFQLHGYELQRILRLCYSNYSLIAEALKDANE